MTIDHQHNSASFGARLKAARENMGLSQKDAAAQLRLSEKYLEMMESDNFSIDLPITFVRGYLRSYAKLLQIPAWEVQKALEPIQPKAIEPDPSLIAKQTSPVTSGNYFMQLFTYLIVLTIVGLAGSWWYRHTPNHPTVAAELAPGTTTPLSPPLPNTASEGGSLALQTSQPLNPTTEQPPPTITLAPPAATQTPPKAASEQPLVAANNSETAVKNTTPSAKSPQQEDDNDDEPESDETD